VTEGGFREAVLDDLDPPRWLIVTRQRGRVKAWLNVCPHAGRALNHAPDRFLTDPDGNLVCAAHGAVFEPGAGQCIAGPCAGASLRAVDVEERDGAVRLLTAM